MMLTFRIIYDERLPKRCRWFPKCVKCTEPCYYKRMIFNERNLKGKDRFERCWVEHSDHFHIYDPMCCGRCPYNGACSDHACGY